MKKDKIPYRQIHLDFHTSSLIDGIGAQFNKAEFIQTLKDAHVNSINLFTKCHHGMFYYPTKIGTMHPNLKFDLFGEQMKACRENDIRAVAYTCVAWNEDWADRHPEWLVLDYNGILGKKLPFDNSYTSWRSLCINNPDYKALLKEEFKEVYDLYHPDGFWIDIVLGKDCVCPHCRKDMKAAGLHPDNYNDVKQFNRMAEIKFCEEFYSYLKFVDNNLEVYFNTMPYELDNGENRACSSIEKRPHFDFIDIESLPSEEWGYTHFPVAANYVNKYEHELCMMNGKFHTSWGDFGTLRHENALEYECFRAVSYGAKLCVGDQLHPSGKLDPTVYMHLGNIFEKIEKLEPWLHNTKKVCDVAVFIPTEAAKEDPASGGIIEEGVYRVLSELHIPFDFVNCEDELSSYSLLIIPDCAPISDSMGARIDKYVSCGGKLLVTGSSSVQDGAFQIKSICADYCGDSPYDIRYIKLNRDSFEQIPNMNHVLYRPGTCVKAKGDILAEFVNPYFSRTYEHFCSHRQTPPQLASDGEPAIVKDSNSIYIAPPLFTAYAEYGYTVYRSILADCIAMLYKKPYLLTDLPALTELTLRKRSDGMILHMLNYVIQKKAKHLDTIEEKFLVNNKFISVKVPFKPSRVLLLPDASCIEFTYSDGYVTIPIDKAQGYTGYFIEE